MLAATDLVDLFTRELALCQLEPKETVVILAEPRSRQDYVAAAFGAAQARGALPIVVTVPGGSPSVAPVVRSGTGYGLRALDENELAVGLLSRANLVVDTTVEGFIHSPVLGRILGTDQFSLEKEGDPAARVLFICEPPDVLARNMPRPEDKQIAVEAAERLRAAKTMTVSSKSGTELSIDLVDVPVGFQCGFADEPGRWDHWPSHMAICFPRPEQVNGVVVAAPGDALFPFKAFIQHAVTFTIESGRLVKIDGHGEAALLNRYIDDSGDPAASITSHFGWGLSRTADWSAMTLYDKESIMGMEARSATGNFMWSTGPNNFLDRFTPYHLDFPMLGCTIELDGVTVVREGVVERNTVSR